MPQCIPVALGERSYEIEIGHGLIASGQAGQRIANLTRGRVCLVTHPALQTPYAEPIAKKLREQDVAVHTVTLPPGERTKSLRSVARLYDAFVDARLDRKSLVVVVGGGVLGDLAGFAAASYLRGIAFVQVPTTLLAQVDSSVGGKTGVDIPQGKNLVGAFHQPVGVVIDTATLTTLPAREFRAGLAEVIKYGIIADAGFAHELAAHLTPNVMAQSLPSDVLTQFIARSCQIKADVVGQDETEQGLRAILNFGHTVGHALEALTRYRRYKHGEAIAIGMVTACLVGEEASVTPAEVTQAVQTLLHRAGLPTLFPADIATADVLTACLRDKKTEQGVLRFVLAHAVGQVSVHDVAPPLVEAAIARHRAARSDTADA